jgi:hypothetical protein
VPGGKPARMPFHREKTVRIFIASLRARALLGAALAAAVPLPGQACSTCACGDNTITLMGAEKPFAGRLRAALDYHVRSETFGGGVDYQSIDEDRMVLGLSYSPAPDATLSVQVPYVHKHMKDATLTETDARGVGDTDVTARLVLWRDQPQLSRHLAGLRAGVRLGTSDEVTDSQGNLVDIDAQPDAGAFAPNVGLWYGYYNMPVFVSFSTAYMFYGHGNQGLDPGDALVASLNAQYGTGNWALQLGLDGRHTGRNRFSGVDDPDSGGTVIALAPGGVLRFGPDFLVHAAVQIPVSRQLNGVQDERTAWRVGVAWDFGGDE